MSDNTNKSDVLMQPIVIPTIGDAGYADSLNEAFDTINKNFVKLSNHDFVKGDAGVSVKIADYKFFNEDGTLTVFGERLKEFIVNMSDRPDIEQADIKDVNEEKVCGLFDYFDANPGSLKMICEWDETEVDPILSPVTSLYYVFMDGRYMGKALSEYERQYENTKDFSCILVYDVDRETGEGKFSSLNNAFPTVYYEKGIGLCWKINGAGSGLPIRGIPGKDGANATLYIVKSTNIEDSIEPGKPTKGRVDGIYESYEGYIPVEDVEDITLLDNQAALILGPKENSADNTFYFGTLALEEVTTEITDEDGNVTTSTEQVLYAYCSSDTSITTGLDTESFINSMKRINLLDNGNNLSSGIKGLFIPLQSPTADNKQKVHLLTAASITNTEGISNDLKSDILWTPINDINTLEVTPDKQLQVDKYLYLKVNNNSTVVKNFGIHTITGNHTIAETNYVLKYKLESILSGGVDRNLNYFDTYNPITASSDSVGSRYYGTANIPISDVTESNNVTLDATNTVVINAEGKEDTNHFASMPSEFYERLNNNLGIYRWVLCDTIHEGWDVSELTDNLASNIETGYSYNFDKRFNTVFTTDLTPGTSSEIMWFNAGEGKAAIATNKYVIPGWITNSVLKETDPSDYIFEFVKFVPIYNIHDGESPIKLDNDTALNINYNVNITGDNTNSRRSLTVHGDINCDNINVYELTATRQIHNIYTENDIVGTAGLIIGRKQDPEDPEDPTKTIPGCTIASSGAITADDIEVGAVTIKKEGHIDAKDITTSSIDTDSITVNYDRTECLYIHKDEQYVSNNNIAVDLNNVGGITVTSGKLTGESTSVVPKITTDMPTQYSNNSNIVITNTSIADASTYVKNANIDADAGSGVIGNSKSERIDTPSFDYAKNYNIYQLNASSDKDILEDKTENCRITPASSNPNYMCKINFPGGYDIKSKTWNIGIDKDKDAYDSINLKKTTPYLQACTISLKDGEKFSKNSGITIDFNNPFVFNIGIIGTCSNGKWPVFMDSSSMTLKFYYKLSNSDTLHHIPQNDLSYTFDTSKKSGNASNNSNNDNGYEWCGYKDGYNSNKDGVKFNWEKDGWAWMYYTYAFTLKSSIYILPSYFSDMIEALNNGVDATIYVIPEFKIRFECQGSNKYLINGLNVTVPRPYKNDSTVIPTNVSSKVIRQTKKYIKLKENNTPDANLKTSQFKYKVFIGGDNTNTLQSSIICNDGITMIAGKHTFGLGYGYAVNHEGQNGYNHPERDKLVWSNNITAEKIPMLYYYDTDVHESIKETSAEKRTKEAYTKRINAIPLKDIFETIQFIREHKAAIEKLGS